MLWKCILGPTLSGGLWGFCPILFAPWIHASPSLLSTLLQCPGRLAFKDCISWAPLPSFPAGFSQREAQQEITGWGRLRLGYLLLGGAVGWQQLQSSTEDHSSCNGRSHQIPGAAFYLSVLSSLGMGRRSTIVGPG